MTSRYPPLINTGHAIGDSALAARLSQEIEGEVLFDAFSRGRYSTDASHYQIEPIGVVVPRHAEDIRTAMQIAGEQDIPMLPRGGGTSQCGQTVGEALVVDVSRHLDSIIALDTEAETVTVEPGIALDQLNAFLAPHGFMFMVDVSTASRATIGGMAGNNSCGARSIRYGTMRDNVLSIDALLADGNPWRFDEDSRPLASSSGSSEFSAATATASHPDLPAALLALGVRERDEILKRFPRLMRRVGGYNIDALISGASNQPGGSAPNLAHLLVGSEGTLAFSTRLTLRLHRTPAHRVLGICHFPTFRAAMEATRHIVALKPAAVELIDRTMLDLARGIPLFRPTIEKFVRGEPESLLLVEFSGEDAATLAADLDALETLMGDLGFPGAVVRETEPAGQREFWDVRKAGLNIMMSMKGDGKPVSFIEDCAVALEDLADYTDRLTAVFERHGVQGTWYAHASVGCLHVRPVINLKQPEGVGTMRAIAEEAFAMVREYKGSHSGEHGDGLVRSEFHRAMFGNQMVGNFEEVKTLFDPAGLMNPGKIVRPPRMDDRSLFRYRPGYRAGIAVNGSKVDSGETNGGEALDWSPWGGFAGAVEMCNNNGACRKFDAGVMCPSYRATKEEKHLVRGRANSLRLALSGQLGPDALTSEEMRETMALCVGCKGCRRECPTGVDMARMKIEFLHHHRLRHGLSIRDRLIAWLPRYAPLARTLGPLLNLRDGIPGLAALSERILGFSAARPLPRWRRDRYRPHRRSALTSSTEAAEAIGDRDIALLPDTFSLYFEPENLRAAERVLEAAGYRVHTILPPDRERPLCCGRTFLSAGLIEEAAAEAWRTARILERHIAAGMPVVGLEPSCTLTLRDEFPALLRDDPAAEAAGKVLLFEEFIAREAEAGRLDLPLRAPGAAKALLHGHCHQKAFSAMPAIERTLGLIPDLETETVVSSCCGMAGAFGYQAETHDVSMQMGELSLLPRIREADDDTLLIADGTSCRQQIRDGTGRQALHVVRILEAALVSNSVDSPTGDLPTGNSPAVAETR